VLGSYELVPGQFAPSWHVLRRTAIQRRHFDSLSSLHIVQQVPELIDQLPTAHLSSIELFVELARPRLAHEKSSLVQQKIAAPND
jgi:hypothetical protein